VIKVKLQDILDKEERSLNWVSTKTGISYSTLHKFCNNKTSSVSYELLYKLSKLFNCQISDLIEVDNFVDMSEVAMSKDNDKKLD